MIQRDFSCPGLSFSKKKSLLNFCMEKEQQTIFLTRVTSSAVQFRLAIKKWRRWAHVPVLKTFCI